MRKLYLNDLVDDLLVAVSKNNKEKAKMISTLISDLRHSKEEYIEVPF